jgi:alkylhydroperoxidase family enzyme
MFGFVTRWGIRSAEKRLGVPLDYLRHMHEHAPGAFWKFTKIAPMAGYRNKLPAAPLYVGCLVATLHEDCGTCVQIGVNLAKQDGVEAETIRATLEGNVEALPEQLRDVYRFADAVVNLTGEEGPYRERLRKVFGEEALVELSMAIAMARTFPTIKRALGYAKSCSLVRVEV